MDCRRPGDKSLSEPMMVIGIDTKIEVIVVSPTTWEAHHSSSAKPSGWASCQIRKIAGAHAPGMSGTFSPSPQVCDPDMHHGTCVTHVP